MPRWIDDETPGHAGDLVGLVFDERGPVRFGDPYRELTRLDVDLASGYLQVLQVACTCGWRSRRLQIEAPEDAQWWPTRINISWALEGRLRFEWQVHARGTVASDQARDRMTAAVAAGLIQRGAE